LEACKNENRKEKDEELVTRIFNIVTLSEERLVARSDTVNVGGFNGLEVSLNPPYLQIADFL
jgi:hypothetical protein